MTIAAVRGVKSSPRTHRRRKGPNPTRGPNPPVLCFALLCFVCPRSDFLLHYNTDTFILRADTAEARPAELYCVFVCAIDHS